MKEKPFVSEKSKLKTTTFMEQSAEEIKREK